MKYKLEAAKPFGTKIVIDEAGASAELRLR